MWIKRIVLENWRAYGRAVFDIPRSKPRENVVVIGAKNGVGKTSLLEAVTLCLFGVKGIDNIVKSEGVGGAKTRYGKFLRGAYNHLADPASPKASVSVLFETNAGTILVNRVWHFGADGDFHGDTVRVQENDEDLTIPAIEFDRDDFLAGEITRRFIPESLLPFFLFDSVGVQDLAKQNMQKQVKEGIEGILGVPVVRQMIVDLRKYSGEQRRKAMSTIESNNRLQNLEQSIEQSEAEVKKLTERLGETVGALTRLREERDALTVKFDRMGGEEVATVGDLMGEIGGLENECQTLREGLAKSLVGDFAMSLAGPDILLSTAERLRKEKDRAKWEGDKEDGEEKYGKFTANFAQMRPLTPPLSEAQASQLSENLKQAWYGVYHPMPAGCADQFLNPGFSSADRNAAIARLNHLSQFSMAEIRNTHNEVLRVYDDKKRLERKLTSVRGDNTEAAKQLKEQISEKRDEISRLEKAHGDIERELHGKNHELARLRQEFSREAERRQGKAPILRRSVLAEKTATIADEVIREAYSQRVSAIAEEMTHAYTSMSRKHVVTQIQISDDCDIKLLTGRGKNIRELPLSHGESQIFTLSLIAAIARVSKNEFPFIIDTPLSFLDTHHRDEFLRFFSSDMDNQVIFLSTDEEIRNERMSRLSHRLAAKFLIEQEQVDGVGRNIVHPNRYFEEDE